MPCFRGIDISIITELEATVLPEYPHPDGASVSLRSSDDTEEGNMLRPEPSLSSINSERSFIQLQKLNPRVSVYIPSLPGAKFWLEYAIDRPPSPPCHLFFKLYMNGSHIVSWGINPRVKTNGTISRALYEPSDRWHYKENGNLLKREGVEARSFHFSPRLEERSVAEEGGTIEIRVFRSHGRRRRAARLDSFRSQERYGITTPSGGLLESPEDATFYDFHLIDSKDSPYATFRFHYRSRDNLEQLNLIPRLSTPESSNATIQDIQPKSEPDEMSRSQFEDDSLYSMGSNDRDDSDPGAHGELNVTRDHLERSPYSLSSPITLRPMSPLSERVPQPSKALRDCPSDSYLQRPLPELPRVSDSRSLEASSRKLSTDSRAPSITSSLLHFVDDESFIDENVELGQATKIILPSASEPAIKPLEQDEQLHRTDEVSSSDYDGSIASSVDNRHPVLLSPGHYLATSGSVLERNLTRFSTPQSLHLSPRQESLSPKVKQILGDEVDNGLDLPRYGSFTMSESEWMRRTPSPSNHVLPATQSSGMWSPRPNRRSRISLLGSLGRSRSRSPHKIIRQGGGHQDSNQSFARQGLDGPAKDWF